jgi:hypothetical protein
MDKTYKDAQLRKWQESQPEIEKIKKLRADLQNWAKENNTTIELCAFRGLVVRKKFSMSNSIKWSELSDKDKV